MEQQIDQHEHDKAKIQKDDVINRNTKKRIKWTKYQQDPQYWATDYIVEFNGNPLTRDFIYQHKNKNELVDFVFNFYKSRGFPFPWYDQERLTKDWMDLLYFDSSLIAKDGDIISSNVKRGNLIFKHFNSHFWQTKDPKSKSAVEIFNNDAEFIDLIRNRLGITFIYRGVSYPFDICGNQIRQGMRSMRKIPHITNFRPAIAKFFYDTYCDQNRFDNIVYDFSHGFGQRFLGAMASNRVHQYCSVDPWKETIEASKKIGGLLNKFGISEAKYCFHVTGSESFCPDYLCNGVNVAFSSPPFYNTEIYSEDLAQAYNNRTYKQFLTDYWIPTVVNIRKLLKHKGILILDIVQKMRKDYEKIILDNGFRIVKEHKMMLARSHLSGKVGSDYDGLVKYEPIIVYQKIK